MKNYDNAIAAKEKELRFESIKKLNDQLKTEIGQL